MQNVANQHKAHKITY